jgi:hypothetical protein
VVIESAADLPLLTLDVQRSQLLSGAYHSVANGFETITATGSFGTTLSTSSSIPASVTPPHTVYVVAEDAALSTASIDSTDVATYAARMSRAGRAAFQEWPAQSTDAWLAHWLQPKVDSELVAVDDYFRSLR